jgi:hypothetical protein
MMTTHDPFQNAFGVYNPFTTPYNVAQWGQQAYGGVPGYGGINPQQLQIAQQLQHLQQLQLAQLLASQAGTQNPLSQLTQQNPLAQQNPFAQNPFAQNPFQNPLATAAIQNPLLAAGLQTQLLGQIGSPLGHPYGFQQPTLYGQTGQTGYPLAPQSMIGQNTLPGTGQGFGQIHPLVAQLAARTFQTPGIAGW